MDIQLDDPYFDEGMKGWIHRYARENLWKVPSSYTVEDLVQEGLVVFVKCRTKYGDLSKLANKEGKDRSPAALRRWFMAIVQRSFANRIADLAKKRQEVDERAVSGLIGADVDEDAFWARHLPHQLEESTLHVLLANAPKEIVAVLQALLSDSKEGLEYVKTRVRRKRVGDTVRVSQGKRAVRETTNEHYCRLAGLDPTKVNIVERMKQYFNPQPDRDPVEPLIDKLVGKIGEVLSEGMAV